LLFWAGKINACGTDAKCLEQARIDVSAAYFSSQEFRDTGSFVYRFYKASYGRQPLYAEFTQDRSMVLGGSDLQARKAAFAQMWVGRPEFKAAYPDGMSAEDFVGKLCDTAGITDGSARQGFIDSLKAGATRSEVLTAIAYDSGFQAREYNPSFVLMEYFGYLERDPDTAGYNFWLNVLDNKVEGNYRSMVCAFVTSTEYQRRFSPVVTHSNGECGQ
jgi:hypothetical protein